MSVAAQVDYLAVPELEAPRQVWLDVCALDDIPVGCGAPALLAGRQVALVRSDDHRVYALSNYDPFSETFVIARGIVGDRGGCPKIASPIFKQSFDLRTGVCLDDPSVALTTYPVRVRAGRIEVGLECAADAGVTARDGVGR